MSPVAPAQKAHRPMAFDVKSEGLHRDTTLLDTDGLWMSTAVRTPTPTPSQDPVYRLFWVATAVTTSHWVLASNAIVYWSDQNLSASSRITPKTPVFSCDSPRGSSQPPQLGHERGGGFPCRDLYLREIGTDPPPSPRCDARHVPARLAHSTTRHAAAHSP